MNQVAHNLNKDIMIDSDLIDLESFDFSDDQTWLFKLPDDSGEKVDIVDWYLSCDWPIKEDEEYVKAEKDLFSLLDRIIKNDVLAMPDRHKFDSRTYVKPKKRSQRPSIQSIVEVPSNPPSLTLNPSPDQSANKYLTYNKYSMPLGPVSPMLRLKTFNVDANTDNSTTVKEYAMKRRSLVQDDDPQLEDVDLTLVSENSDRFSSEHLPSKPINIDLSQPAHNLHNTFNKGLTNIMNERGSITMYQSGESLMRMSPPSLVSSIMMESSGNFNHDSMDGRKSMPSHKDPALLAPARDSIDPMLTSMTLSILDEKDMSTSFLSQTTYPDNDSFMDSMPPSLVSSVNSSFVVSNSSRQRPENGDLNVFSSPTYTHLEQSEKLLSARPRCSMFNSYPKRESAIRSTESYTKTSNEPPPPPPPPVDTQQRVLNENTDKKETPKNKPSPGMSETITLHYSNNKFRRADAEKENLNSTFEKDDAFYKDMGVPKVDPGKNSLNVTLDKQELNEIIQARQKLSLARKALPAEADKPLPNQVEVERQDKQLIQLPNKTIVVPKQSMENASELLSRRRALNANNGLDRHDETGREPPKRNATFKKPSPSKCGAMDATVVYMRAEDKRTDGQPPRAETQMIDINSATMSLIDSSDRTLREQEWGAQDRAMVGSSESTDTGTFSSSSPPDAGLDAAVAAADSRAQVASTPLLSLRRGKDNLLGLHNTISPIYDIVDDKSYTLASAGGGGGGGGGGASERGHDSHNATVISTATILKRAAAKRDILAARTSPDKKTGLVTNTPSYGLMAPPSVSTLPRKTSLPTSKLRQYSSHKELNRIPGNPAVTGGARAPPSAGSGRTMTRRGVYASNPALSPTAPSPAHPAYPAHPAPPVRQDSYVIVDQQCEGKDKSASKPPPLVRQGTETLRRERPLSQLVAPKDVRAGPGGSGVPVSMRTHQIPPPTTRPYSIAGASQLRVSRPASTPTQRPAPASATHAHTEPPRPASSGAGEGRASALPRPTRLPAPRRTLRPPSVYSVAQTGGDMEHY